VLGGMRAVAGGSGERAWAGDRVDAAGGSACPSFVKTADFFTVQFPHVPFFWEYGFPHFWDLGR
jgi:hypothetical protein